jgi:hypothetical protein
MAPRGRPPKPIEQKRLAGNVGKRPLPDNTIQLVREATEVIEPPRPLGATGREFWDRIWGMANTWLSPESDLELLMITSELIDERWSLRVTVFRDGRPEDRKALRNLDKQLVANLSLLGFSPTDRSRLGIAEVKRQTKLEELRTRIDESKK